ncbi:hypothetical protein B0T16DRAFT_420300 [Cercophora newfieldiana]|uniref:Uncharacterized protein n=1 Tax=Cercophora newfieldiana TaxID=92897 RepID=A0AA40CKC9_9PEZI|nr:hypothetical protein B0T16DRAFT_420300 [Cercophora newfieldiana]
MPLNEISRDGFCSAYGRFRTSNGVERVSTETLKGAFLPQLTPSGKTFLKNHRSFVRDQFRHYGVDYAEGTFSGNGTLLMRKMLQDGRLDKIPDHIRALEAEMHAEWLQQLLPKDLLGRPEFTMEKYFIDALGQPDKTRTTRVIGIPHPEYHSRDAKQLCDVAAKVPGLHHAIGLGSKQTVYLGWKKANVDKAAQNFTVRQEKADRIKQEIADRAKEEAARRAKEWEARKANFGKAARDARHQKYLDDMVRARQERRSMPGPSPYGEYTIDCDEIRGGWDVSDDFDMTMKIRWNERLRVYEATFDFNILEGVIIFSANEALLDQASRSRGRGYFDEEGEEEDDKDEDSEEDGDSEEGEDSEEDEDGEEGSEEDEDDEDGSEEDDEEDPTVTASRKRKAPTSKGTRGRLLKKAKKSGKPMSFSMRMRSSDTDTGEVHSDAEKGTIKFTKADFSTFTAVVGMPCVGSAVKFTGRKVRFAPMRLVKSWDDYSEAAYERARVSRWR